MTFSSFSNATKPAEKLPDGMIDQLVTHHGPEAAGDDEAYSADFLHFFNAICYTGGFCSKILKFHKDDWDRMTKNIEFMEAIAEVQQQLGTEAYARSWHPKVASFKTYRLVSY